jgi:hypothetical protein
MRASLVVIELLVLASCVGCKRPKPAPAPPPSPSSTSAPDQLRAALTPRSAGHFSLRDGKLRQEHPRLPDTGEWRCAERARIVWCAGGEPAAGVVAGPNDAGFRCGPRWGQDGSERERVCIDEHPDYPGNEAYQCSFDQERGIARVCRVAEPTPAAVLAPNAVAACWLDRDCPSGRCDRGACTCVAQADCQSGSCQRGTCVEVNR